MRRIASFLTKQDWIVVGWVIAIKLLLFLVGVKSYPILWDRYAPRPYNWLQIWDQWDFGYYQKGAAFRAKIEQQHLDNQYPADNDPILLR